MVQALKIPRFESGFLGLPNEILFKVLSLLDNHDINNLYNIDPIRRRISTLFTLVSDILPSHNFPNITNAYTFEEALNLKEYGRTQPLWVLIEVHDLKHTHILLPQFSQFVNNKMSIFDDHLPFSWDPFVENSNKWLENISYKTKSITFENLVRLSLSDVSIDPKLLAFPRLEILKLTRVQSSDPKSKFQLPKLSALSVSGFFKTINSSIDYENSPQFKKLTITGVMDTMTWSNIKNSSLEVISFYESGSLVKFVDLEFQNLERLIIKETDVTELSHIYAPSLISIHLEQFLTADITIKHLFLPKLTHLLLWTFEISNLYDVFVPALRQASIMLSNEPQPSETNNIDLSCFASVTSLQICCAAEVLKHIDNLISLEVRGPFTNPLLFNLEFDHLKSLHVYFNNRLTEVPSIKAKYLEALTISRCSMVSDIRSIEKDYPRIKSLAIEYSELRELSNFSSSVLEKIMYVTSTSAPLFVRNCVFPRLKTFEAINLEINSSESSVFEFEAPILESLRISNFSVDQLNVHGYPELRQITAVGGIKNISIKDCESLRDLNISRNELQVVTTDRLERLVALECEDTNIWHSSIDTPLLKRVNEDGTVRFYPNNI